MVTRKSIKLGTGLAAGLLMLGLSTTPARADHGHDVVAPAAAFLALGWMLHHGHHGHHRHYEYYKHHRKHGHSSHKRHHRGHYRHQRKHSHSHGGYHRQKRHVRY
jgi:hypothetical protein